MGLFDRFKSTEKTNDNAESTCRYYENGTCVAGGQKNNCSANPHACENCFVWKLHAQGDLSAIY